MSAPARAPRRESRSTAPGAGGPAQARLRPVGPSAGPARPLAILHLITRLDRGGSSDCTLLQAVAAAGRGHRVTVACGPTRNPSPLLAAANRIPGLTCVEVPSLRRPLSPLADARALLFLVRLLRSQRFDIVHTHTSKAGALGRIAAALGSRARVVHQPHGHLFYGYHGRMGSALVVLAERLLASLASRQIVLSRRGAEEHVARGIGAPDQFRVVRSGIDLRPFRRAEERRAACRARLGIHDGELAIGTLCRLEPIKGVEDLLRGFLVASAGRPHLRLVLGGDGPLRDRLAILVREAGAQAKVRVSDGWVDAAGFLPALDLFALVSRNEGMGRSLVEAMATGLPVLVTRVGGMPEVIEEGGAGLLVPAGDSDAIAQALGRLADDPSLRRDLGRRARSRAVAFGAGRMGHAVLRVYREILR